VGKPDLEGLEPNIEEGGGGGGVGYGDRGGELQEVQRPRIHPDVGDVGRLVPLQRHVRVGELWSNRRKRP
jgi:hypothetical protein